MLNFLRLVVLVFVALFAHAVYAKDPAILIVGDSLSAGFGIDPQKSWPALLERRLAQEGYSYRVVNASISGETSLEGRGRLHGLLLEHHPAVLIIELGGNDGLRALPLKELHANLAFMIQTAQREQVKVLLAGMRLPPNYGLAYTEKFQAVYRDLAERYKLAFVPFLLEGIGGKNELMLPDMIHPRVEAQPVILNNIWPKLKPLLGGRNWTTD